MAFYKHAQFLTHETGLEFDAISLPNSQTHTPAFIDVKAVA